MDAFGSSVSFSSAASGNVVLLDGESSRRIVVTGFAIFSAGAVETFRLTDESGTEVLGSATVLAKVDQTGSTAPAGFVLPRNSDGWLRTAPGEDLILVKSSTGPVFGCFSYRMAP